MGGRDLVRVAVLMGGTSVEHDVSVCSGLNVLAALDSTRFEGGPVYVGRDGCWRFGLWPPAPDLSRPPDDAAEPGDRREPNMAAPGVAPDQTGDTFERLQRGEYDVVFLALHGPGGEDGTVQGLLELAGVPYTGSGVLASALAMDKILAKRVLQTAGVPVAADAVVRSGPGDPDRAAAACTEVLEKIGLPCVVKPACSGSSFGTGRVLSEEQLPAALAAAWRQDRRALVEPYLRGVEVTCGVLGGGVEPMQPLPLTEIVPAGSEFFDFRAKYTAGACREITPARIDQDTARQVQQLALVAHEQLGCEGMSRTDFILTEEGPVALETNTIPGMTAGSLLPQEAAAAGIDFPDLVTRLIDSALARQAAR